MVLYVLDAAAQEDVRATVVVVGHGATWVEKALTERARADVNLVFVEQSEQLGTGHAVSVALPTIDDELGTSDGDVLILPGDTPLLRPSTVARLLDVHRESQAALTVLTAEVDDPSGYGRIVHAKNGAIARIVEERDASADERLITEINTARSGASPRRSTEREERVLPDRPHRRVARSRSRHTGTSFGGPPRGGRRE
jgi:bifunctional UDP-N-acetylglucosamine pyrophosphorylase/glucosamine-1-phosphate N-acetyltransferase